MTAGFNHEHCINLNIESYDHFYDTFYTNFFLLYSRIRLWIYITVFKMLCDVICMYEIPLPSLYCGICEVHICKACEKKHLQGESKLHEIVSFKNREIILKCQINPQKFVKFIVNNVISKFSFSVRFLKSSKDIKFML